MAERPRLLVLGNASSEHLAPWLRPFAEEFEVHVATLAPGRLSGPWQEHRLPARLHSRLDYLLAVPSLQRLIGAVRPDLLHVHYAMGYGMLGAMVRSGCPRLLTTWGSDVAVTPANSGLARAILRWMLPRYAWVNTPASHLRDMLLAYGARPEQVELFPYGVEAARLPRRAPSGDRREVRIISPRHWDPIYRIDDLVLGFGEYCRRGGPLATLTLVGRGSAADAQRLRSVIERADCGDRLRWPGYLAREELLQELGQADVFASIPMSDGASTALLECLVIGLYPIVSELPANRAWVSEADGTFLVDASPHGVADAIAVAVARVRAGYDGGATRARVLETADYDTNMRRLRAVYQRLLSAADHGADRR